MDDRHEQRSWQGRYSSGDNGHRGNQTDSVTKKARDDMDQLVSGVKQSAREAAASVRDKAEQEANRRKDDGAERLHLVARAAERAAEELDQRMPLAAKYVRRTAKQVEDFSESLAQRSFEDIAREFSSLARARPGLVLGAGALAGFALTRFLKNASFVRTDPEGPVSSPSMQEHHFTGMEEQKTDFGPSLQPNGDVP
jgi:hypothetical protein